MDELRSAFYSSSASDQTAAYACLPGDYALNGDIWFGSAANSNGFDGNGKDSAGYSFTTSLHEIGHAIGSSHSFDGAGINGTTLTTGPLTDDIMRNTLMSYTNLDRNSYINFSITGGDNYDYQSYNQISAPNGGY